MAAIVVCTNVDCPQFNIQKDNSAGFDTAEIFCGACHSPVSDYVAAEPSQQAETPYQEETP